MSVGAVQTPLAVRILRVTDASFGSRHAHSRESSVMKPGWTVSAQSELSRARHVRTEDLLLRIQQLQRGVIFETLEVNAVAGRRSCRRIDDLDGALLFCRRAENHGERLNHQLIVHMASLP